MNYNVGDILWAIRENDMQVFPIRIIEKINTQRLNVDAEINYNVSIPSQEAAYSLQRILRECKIFSTAEELRSYMITNATSKIDELIVDAKSLEGTLL